MTLTVFLRVAEKGEVKRWNEVVDVITFYINYVAQYFSVHVGFRSVSFH